MINTNIAQQSIQHTDEQKAAIDKMKKFLRGGFPEEYEFSLIGAAGTGKTTILKEVVKGYPRSIVLGATVSHAAKNVLHDSAGHWMRCFTIAKLLGLKPDVNKQTGKQIFIPDNNRKNAPPVTEAKILIIDECSMIDASLHQLIRESVMEDTYIIYSGDKFQLPPVDESEEHIASPTFDCNLKAELTVPMRFDNIIGESALFYRETINIYNYYKGINVASFNNWRPVKTNGESSIEFTHDYNYFINKSLNFFYHDRKNTRMLAYRNYTIDMLNNYIRAQFYPYHDDLYVAGEYIITNKPYGEHVYNGEIFYISDVDIGYIKAPILEPKENVNGYKIVDKPIKVYLLEIKYRQEDEEYIDELPIVHQDAKETYDGIRQYMIEVAKENKNWWKRYYEFLNTFADVSKTYVTSTHKAQGQSIDNVFVMANDIIATQRIPLKVKLQSLYVAVTRARKHLTVLI